ncbi:MAG: hypothetical protein ACE5JX_03985 [Acidobacteriota bacterium]
MAVESLLVLFVGVTAVAFTVQCLSVWRTSRSINRMVSRLQRQVEQVESKLRVVENRLLEVSGDLKPLGTMAEKISAGVTLVSERVRGRAEDLDHLIDELAAVAREQASKIDYLVTDTVQKFEQTTEVIQKDVLRPAVEITSFVKGVKSGLEVLFSKRSGTSEPPREEELFL